MYRIDRESEATYDQSSKVLVGKPSPPLTVFSKENDRFPIEMVADNIYREWISFRIADTYFACFLLVRKW